VSVLTSRRGAAARALLLAAGACALAAGCSAGGSSAGATMAPAASGHAARAANGVAGAGTTGQAAVSAGAAAGRAAPAGAGTTAGRAAGPLPGGQAVIFTASPSLRTRNVHATGARAPRPPLSAGGSVAGGHASVVRVGRPATPRVDIQFKIPAGAYQATLGALGSLGTKRSETQRAQDVTGTVADVNSRVASAEAAIAQLRKLLTRAGSGGALLTVQEQINQEEASLEALQSQHRA